MNEEFRAEGRDIRAECVRLVAAAEAAGIRLRALGGLAVSLHGHGRAPASLDRRYGDIDMVVRGVDARKLSHLLPDEGWAANRRFNALHGERRMIFEESTSGTRLDVFIGEFSMCHKLDLDSRLPERGVTLELSDLLLTKLQVVQITVKDLTDVFALLVEHEVVSTDHADEAVAVNRLVQVCARDWGWYTTVTDNLQRVVTAAGQVLDPDAAAVVSGRADTLRLAIEVAPKTLAWRARSKVGRRVAWYELPEEIDK